MKHRLSRRVQVATLCSEDSIKEEDAILDLALSMLCHYPPSQVLHTKLGHWVTVTSIGCAEGKISIYDSLPLNPSNHLMNHDQIAARLPHQRSYHPGAVRFNQIAAFLQLLH